MAFSSGYYGSCPRCGHEIPQRGYVTGFAICECGWNDRTPTVRGQIQVEKKASIALIGAAIFLVALYVHLLNWGGYAISAPIDEIGKITGLLSPAGYHELAKACEDLAKYSCAQDVLLADFESQRDVTALAKLAHLQIRLGGDAAAPLATLQAYFAAGGKEAQAYLDYGRLLEAASRYDEAVAAYQASITASGETLPVFATTALVHVMMKLGKFEEAFAKIEEFYASAGNAKGYLNLEHAQLEKYMDEQARKRITLR